MNEKGNQINKLLPRTEKLLLDKNMKRILAKRAGSSAWSERSADKGASNLQRPKGREFKSLPAHHFLGSSPLNIRGSLIIFGV